MVCSSNKTAIAAIIIIIPWYILKPRNNNNNYQIILHNPIILNEVAQKSGIKQIKNSVATPSESSQGLIALENNSD